MSHHNLHAELQLRPLRLPNQPVMAPMTGSAPDLVSFGVKFPANPDFPERLRPAMAGLAGI